MRGTLSNGLSFVAYTYAGELPSCAFGFNNHGLVRTVLIAGTSKNNDVRSDDKNIPRNELDL